MSEIILYRYGEPIIEVVNKDPWISKPKDAPRIEARHYFDHGSLMTHDRLLPAYFLLPEEVQTSISAERMHLPTESQLADIIAEINRRHEMIREQLVHMLNVPPDTGWPDINTLIRARLGY